MPSTTSRRTPLWAIALAGVLQLTGGAKPRRDLSPADASRISGRGAHSTTPHLRNQQSGADRGRHADSPAEIPVQGWKDIAYRIYQGISEDRIIAISAGVTFFVLLALFPGIAGLISLYGLFADSSSIGQHLETLSGVLPEGATQIVGEQIQRLTSQPAQKLGFAMITGLAISLWSANGGMKAMFDALNIVYHEKEKRGFFRLNAISLALTFGAVAFVIVSLISITVVPMIMEYLGLSSLAELLVKTARWPLLLVVSSFFIATIYRYGPSRDKPKWRWITPGSVLAAVLWLAASLLFSWYAENFGSYNKTYGSLGAVIGFMTWLWLSTIVVLVGGKLNAEMEHQTAKDTTEGHPQPLGQRGAQMADTVGTTSR
jgi:membrane protein